jgi:aminoglycoside 6-adenylyltransferase
MKAFEERIVAWANSQPAIRAVLVVGSQARRDRPADEWSDLDTMVFCTDYEPYWASKDWLGEMGTLWTAIPGHTSGDDPEWLALYDGGFKVDYVLFPVDALRRLAQAEQMDGVYQRGYYVLVDKDGWAARLPPPTYTPPSYERPSEHEFALAVNAFWYGAVYVAKQIRRRNLWVVKYRDWTLKETLLRMVEWHARAMQGWEHDTWHDGHHMASWIDAGTWEALHDTFGRFGAADAWRALMASMALFARLAGETAAQLGYAYPQALDAQVSQYVDKLHSEDDLSQ